MDALFSSVPTTRTNHWFLGETMDKPKPPHGFITRAHRADGSRPVTGPMRLSRVKCPTRSISSEYMCAKCVHNVGVSDDVHDGLHWDSNTDRPRVLCDASERTELVIARKRCDDFEQQENE